ncbi:hypothetical protein Tco_0176323 [Tanacetum coccineum]
MYQFAKSTCAYGATDSKLRFRNHSVEEQRGMDQGEVLIVQDSDKSTDKGSESTDDMANVLCTLGAANVVSSRGKAFIIAGVATASESFPIAGVVPIVSATTTYSRRVRVSRGISIESQ